MTSSHLTVYDASGRDRMALSAWRTMFAELRAHRELIQRLVLRNLSGQFRQSFLGYLWVALPPVATTVVFALLRRAEIVNVPMPAGAMPYVLFALIGTTLWGFFTQATMMATTSIAGAGSLVAKIYFPREVLILSAVGNAVVNLAIRVLIVGLTFALVGYRPHAQAVLFPLLLVPLLALAVGLGLLFAPLNTMMQDVHRVLEFTFQFGMFLAPTVYPTPVLDAASGRWAQVLYWLHTLNPVTHFLQAINTLVETGRWVPDAGFWCATLISFTVLLLGWRFFHVCEPLLAERL